MDTSDSPYSASKLFDLDKTILSAAFDNEQPAWEILTVLEKEVLALGNILDSDYINTCESIWVHKNANIAKGVTINGPAIICCGAELRPGAYIRGPVLVGKNAVVGNSTEVKNAVLFDGVSIPHFNYVGDSVLGAMSHLGAGAILSNVRLDTQHITIKHAGIKIETGLRKFGALVGDNVQIGCNAVINPGTIIGRNAFIYPLKNAGGVIGEGEKIY